MSDVSEGAIYLCNNLYSSTNTNYGATSMLCTGASWDSMLDFIKDSNHSVKDSITWGNYYDSETYKVYRGSLGGVISNSSVTWSQANTTTGTDVTKNNIILLTTGATERNSSKNIYDVAGNCLEWTTESGSSNGRVNRGRLLPRLWKNLSSELPQQPRSERRLQCHRLSSSTLCKTVRKAGNILIKYLKVVLGKLL